MRARAKRREILALILLHPITIESRSHSPSIIPIQNQKPMFEFQNLEVYKNAKVFHITCKTLLNQRKLDGDVLDQMAEHLLASLSILTRVQQNFQNQIVRTTSLPLRDQPLNVLRT